MTGPVGRTTLRTDVQALRALAVVGVVVCHMNPAWLPGGYLGVDVFFVVSGFVITLWLQERQRGINLTDFWLQRVLRIVPAYMVMLTVVASVTAIVFLPENFQQFLMSWLKSLLFLSNQYFAGYGDYFSPTLHEQPLLHTWSLAIEMQFYLVYPILYIFLQRSGQLWILPAVSIAGWICAEWVWSSTTAPSALYYALPVRAPEFLLGCSLALFPVGSDSRRLKSYRDAVSTAGLTVIIACFIFASEEWFRPAIAAIACTGTSMVIWGQSRANLLARIFESRWTLMLGALSYSIYLWHWPILALARYGYGTIHWNFVLVLAYVVLVLGLAWVSWYWIESRFRVHRITGRSGLLIKLLALGLVALSPLAYAKQLNAEVPALAIELTRYAADDTICHGKILSSCVRASGPAQFLMIGDSHAAQLNMAADVSGRQLDTAIEVITASSCIPLVGFNVSRLSEWAQAPCLKQIQTVKERLERAHYVILAGMWSYQFQDMHFPDVLEQFYESAKAMNQQVLVLGQIPKFRKNPLRLVRLQYLGIRILPEADTDWQVANSQMRQLLMKHPEIRYFDPATTYLFSTAPFYQGTLVYSDEHHLNEVGSREYGILLSQAMQQISAR